MEGSGAFADGSIFAGDEDIKSQPLQPARESHRRPGRFLRGEYGSALFESKEGASEKLSGSHRMALVFPVCHADRGHRC
jgi:hypothetical protein